MNTLTEVELLRTALPMTPTGLEGLSLRRPEYFDPKRDVPVTERCSAFAATGPATRDGKMVIGHITMWPLLLAEQTNIMLDIKPAAGHRVLMQGYPGAIQSGMDYYQNDAGMVLTETTIRQSPFNLQGTPVAYRARRAIQYGGNVDEVVEHLSTRNNGLYTNEWLIGDAKDNQIAMLELGTYKTKLYRSSKKEWFGGTEGFYWGCNNAKDLAVRLEYATDPKGTPAHLPYVPAPRDLAWQKLFESNRGKIDEQFGFTAFRTAPLVSSNSFDAKVATSDLASRMMFWAVFGKPNQREWTPTPTEREAFPPIQGIYSSGYRLIQAEPAETLRAAVQEREMERLAKPEAKPATKTPEKHSFKDQLWKGWILPASDADLWLSAGAAAYHQALSADEWEKEIAAHRAGFLAAALRRDQPLSKLAASTQSWLWFDLAAHKGSLLLEALRAELGDKRFFALMTEFFDAHSTRNVDTAKFQAAADKAAGKSLSAFFSAWLDQPGLPEGLAGAAYTASHLRDRLPTAILVYGTVRDAGANRHAAEILQGRFLNWLESSVPIYKDFEASDEDLRSHDVVFVGRPESNSALSRWQEQLGLDYAGALFRVDGATNASENQALMLAAANPVDRSRMVLILAGNSALETVRLASAPQEHYEYAIYDSGKRTAFGFQTAGKRRE